MFEYPMMSKPVLKNDNEISHYTLVDGEVVSILSRKMNFKPVYLKTDRTRWGSQLPNGNFIHGVCEDFKIIFHRELQWGNGCR